MALYKYPYNGKYKDYIATWGNDRDCEIYEKDVDAWLSQFPNEHEELLMELLKKFNMFRGRYYSLCIKDLFKKYVEYNPDWETTARFFEVKKDKNKVNNSDEFFLDFWKNNEIKDYCRGDIEETCVTDKNLQQIVLVDDFSGTGKTIKDFLLLIKEKFPDVVKYHIIILVLVCTNMAEESILDCGLENNLDIQVLYVKKFNKIFIPDYKTTSKAIEAKKQNYLDICKRFRIQNPLGYGDAEALVAFDYNTPNDTLGIFWEEQFDNVERRFKGLRPRKHYDMIRQGSKSSCKLTFKNKEGDYKYLIFSYVCICCKARFSKSKIMNLLGLTNSQFRTRLDYCLQAGYLVNQKGKFVEGIRLKNIKIKASDKIRIKEVIKKGFNCDTQFADNNILQFDSSVSYICKDFDKRQA